MPRRKATLRTWTSRYRWRVLQQLLHPIAACEGSLGAQVQVRLGGIGPPLLHQQCIGHRCGIRLCLNPGARGAKYVPSSLL